MDLVPTQRARELGAAWLHCPGAGVLVNGSPQTSVSWSRAARSTCAPGDAFHRGPCSCLHRKPATNIHSATLPTAMGLSLNEYSGSPAVESGKREIFRRGIFYGRLGLPGIPRNSAPACGADAAQQGSLHSWLEARPARFAPAQRWSDGATPSRQWRHRRLPGLRIHGPHRPLAGPRRRQRPVPEVWRRIARFSGNYRNCTTSASCRVGGGHPFRRAHGFPGRGPGRAGLAPRRYTTPCLRTGTMTRAHHPGPLEHPSVTIIGPMSPRLLGQRRPTDFDLEACCRRQGQPHALDIQQRRRSALT